MDVLYPKARLAFQNMSGSEYLEKMKPYLGEPGYTQGAVMAKAPHAGAVSSSLTRLLLV